MMFTVRISFPAHIWTSYYIIPSIHDRSNAQFADFITNILQFQIQYVCFFFSKQYNSQNTIDFQRNLCYNISDEIVIRNLTKCLSERNVL